MIGWGLDTISKELIWALVVVAVIVAVAVVSLLRKIEILLPLCRRVAAKLMSAYDAVDGSSTGT